MATEQASVLALGLLKSQTQPPTLNAKETLDRKAETEDVINVTTLISVNEERQ